MLSKNTFLGEVPGHAVVDGDVREDEADVLLNDVAVAVEIVPNQVMTQEKRGVSLPRSHSLGKKESSYDGI